MKTRTSLKLMFKSFLFILTMLTINIAHASDTTLTLKLNKLGNKMLTASINYNDKNDFTISLQDDINHELWKLNLENSLSFSKNFDLSLLPNGVYSFEVEDEYSISISQITIVGTEMSFSEERKIYKPVFVQDNELVTLTFKTSNLNYGEIDVIDPSGEKLYSETIGENENFKKTFDFSEVENEYFLIATTLDNKRFYYTVNNK